MSASSVLHNLIYPFDPVTEICISQLHGCSPSLATGPRNRPAPKKTLYETLPKLPCQAPKAVPHNPSTPSPQLICSCRVQGYLLWDPSS